MGNAARISRWYCSRLIALELSATGLAIGATAAGDAAGDAGAVAADVAAGAATVAVGGANVGVGSLSLPPHAARMAASIAISTIPDALRIQPEALIDAMLPRVGALV
jgi:hypothetical protein